MNVLDKDASLGLKARIALHSKDHSVKKNSDPIAIRLNGPFNTLGDL